MCIRIWIINLCKVYLTLNKLYIMPVITLLPNKFKAFGIIILASINSSSIFSLEKIIKDHKKVTLNVHPFVAAYLKKGLPSLRSKWFFGHKKWVKIIPRDAYTYLEYHFNDKKGNGIKE